jgi:hypothetical protein
MLAFSTQAAVHPATRLTDKMEEHFASFAVPIKHARDSVFIFL